MSKVAISSKFTNKPAGYANTETGVYWESMFQLTGDDVTIQQALIKHRREVDKKIEASIKLNGYCTDEEIVKFTQMKIN